MSNIKSSFHGKIKELPGVFVDNFEDVDFKSARAYFLSHCHRDHTQGLYSAEFLKKLQLTQDVYVYTTELSARVIKYEADDVRIMKYVRTLKMGFNIISLPPTKTRQELLLNITLIPAGHCLGSSMFLFQTPDITVLYTGDFRIRTNDIPKHIALHDNGRALKIDAMYLDTTFLNSDHRYFPKRSDCMNEALAEIKKWLDRPNGHVGLSCSAKYGYEFVFNEIYKKLGVKVYVGEMWDFYRSIQHLVPGVTNRDSRVHRCGHNAGSNHATCAPLAPPAPPADVLRVRLSAMLWRGHWEDDAPVNYRSSNSLEVCFATHCSEEEVIKFVDYFSPAEVVGFPNTYTPRLVRQMDEKVDEYTKRENTSLLHKKVDPDKLKLMFQ